MAADTASVGVVVPVHGWAPYLAETLDAVVAERPGAVVVVDDGSDPPLRLLDEHLEAGCRLLRLPERRGLAGARAAGMASVSLPLLALCDGDDVWETGSLGLRVAALGSAAACFARSVIVGPDGLPTGEVWEVGPGSLSLPELYERNPLCVSGAVLRRDAVVAAGGLEWPLRRAEDWDLWLRLLGRGERLVYEPQAVVRYRRRAGALSGDIAGLARDQLAVHERHAGLVSPEVAGRARVADLRALAAGLVRVRRYDEAREALGEAGAGGSVRAAVLGVPGLRALVGRRDPYRRG